MRRWICPTCGSGVNGTERPRKDDVRRHTTSYLMGVLDGEGTIAASASATGRVVLTVAVVMGPTDEVHRLFEEQFGGTVAPVAVGPGRRPLWKWQTSGSRALPFLTVASDLLVVKREQAQLAIELASQMSRYAAESRAGRPKGAKWMSDEDAARRHDLQRQIQSLNRSVS